MVTLFLFVDVLVTFVVVVVVALLPKYLCRTEYMLNKPIPQSCTVATLILILQVKILAGHWRIKLGIQELTTTKASKVQFW